MCTNKKIYQPVAKSTNYQLRINPNQSAMNFAQVKMATDVLILLSHRWDVSLGQTVERLKRADMLPAFYAVLGDNAINYSKVRMVNRLQKQLDHGK